MLILENVSKALGGKNIISNLSFSFGGQLLAITGKNGVGKTTLLKLLAGLLNADSGVMVYGKAAPISTTLRVSYAPSRLSFGLNLPPKFFVETLMRAKSETFNPTHLDQAWQEWLIPTDARSIHDLSFGNIQKLNLIQAIHCKADVYIFDEPTNGLDQEGKELFLQSLGSLAGSLVVICSHALDTLSRISNQIYRLENGATSSSLSTINLQPRYEVSYQISDEFLSVIVDSGPEGF